MKYITVQLTRTFEVFEGHIYFNYRENLYCKIVTYTAPKKFLQLAI